MGITVDPALLVGQWAHAHEEDKGAERVFRPANSAFPPSRGRRVLDIQADGVLGGGRPGPSDKTALTPGRWSVSEDGSITLSQDGEKQERYRVRSQQVDRLVLVKA